MREEALGARTAGGNRAPGFWPPKSAGQSKLHRAQFGVAHNVRNRFQNHKGGVTANYYGNCPAERSHSNSSVSHNKTDWPPTAPYLPQGCGELLAPAAGPQIRNPAFQLRRTSAILAGAPWYALPFARPSSNHRCPASGRSTATGGIAPREMRPRGLRAPKPCAPP